jgi:hypothetical protein
VGLGYPAVWRWEVEFHRCFADERQYSGWPHKSLSPLTHQDHVRASFQNYLARQHHLETRCHCHGRRDADSRRARVQNARSDEYVFPLAECRM